MDEAAIVAYEPRRVEIAASAAENATLLLTDTYYPGWNAYVDGEPAPLWRGNYLFRAVPVPAGVHVVELRYEPVPFRIGAVVSLGSLAALLALATARGSAAEVRR